MFTTARGFLLHGPHHLLTPPLLKFGFSYQIPLEVSELVTCKQSHIYIEVIVFRGSQGYRARQKFISFVLLTHCQTWCTVCSLCPPPPLVALLPWVGGCIAEPQSNHTEGFSANACASGSHSKVPRPVASASPGICQKCTISDPTTQVLSQKCWK